MLVYYAYCEKQSFLFKMVHPPGASNCIYSWADLIGQPLDAKIPEICLNHTFLFYPIMNYPVLSELEVVLQQWDEKQSPPELEWKGTSHPGLLLTWVCHCIPLCNSRLLCWVSSALFLNLLVWPLQIFFPNSTQILVVRKGIWEKEGYSSLIWCDILKHSFHMLYLYTVIHIIVLYMRACICTL